MASFLSSSSISFDPYLMVAGARWFISCVAHFQQYSHEEALNTIFYVGGSIFFKIVCNKP